MKKETLKSIFNFLEEKEKKIAPLKWKIVNNEPITKDDLIVKGDLDLINSPNITSLPEELYVERTLFLNNCKNLTSLPKGLKVGLNLYVGGTPLAKYSGDELREMIKPGGFINGKTIR